MFSLGIMELLIITLIVIQGRMDGLPSSPLIMELLIITLFVILPLILLVLVIVLVAAVSGRNRHGGGPRPDLAPCPHCRTLVPLNLKSCPSCGKALT